MLPALTGRVEVLLVDPAVLLVAKNGLAISDGIRCSSPRVLYLHGGSWMYSAPDSDGYDALAGKLAGRCTFASADMFGKIGRATVRALFTR